ncbi:MAG: hypothetical protein Q9160_004447 [Pyrenula sp. 1 TL-2023]
MHELLLFGQVPAHRHQKTLHQLSGVTRMQPKRIVEQHLVFRATPPNGSNQVQVGASQGVVTQDLKKTQAMLSGGLYHIQAVARYEVEDYTPATNHSDTSKSSISLDIPGSTTPRWSIEFRDIPEAGAAQTVTSRSMSTIAVDDGDVVQFVKTFGYEFHSQHVQEGYKFYEQDSTLFLYRTLTVNGESAPGGDPDLSSPLTESLSPLDPQGGFILEASTTLLDGNNHDLRTKAMQQLYALKDTFKSEVALQPADRLALDTRVSTIKAGRD